jgi:hypothetical protein
MIYSQDCFLPVSQNLKISEISLLFSQDEIRNPSQTVSSYSPSIPFIEFIKVSSFFGNDPQELQGRIFVSGISEARGEVLSVNEINSSLFLEISFFSSLLFYKNEDITSLKIDNETSNITLRVLERHFKKPEELVLALEDRKKLEILKRNENFSLRNITSNLFNHRNNITIIKDSVTKKSRIMFFQESNLTSLT